MAGRSRLQNSLPPSPFSSSHLHIIWPLNLSLVPEVQGKFFLLPELPLALQEVSVKLDKEIKEVGGVSPGHLQFPDIPTPVYRVPYLGGVTDPANVSENGVRAHRHVLQDHLKPQSHHSCQPAHQGWVHSTRHATLQVRKQTSLATCLCNLQLGQRAQCLEKKYKTVRQNNKDTRDLESGVAYNSAIDDSSELHLLSPQAVQVQGQALKQALVTQLQQPGSKSTVCREGVRGRAHDSGSPAQPLHPSPWLAPGLTCAVQHMGSDAVKLLLEKF